MMQRGLNWELRGFIFTRPKTNRARSSLERKGDPGPESGRDCPGGLRWGWAPGFSNLTEFLKHIQPLQTGRREGSRRSTAAFPQ